MALRGIDQQEDAIDQFQSALHLAAEIGMTWGIDDVDPHAVVLDGGVLGHDGDALLTLEVDRVEHPLADRLMGTEYAALPQHGVDQGGLAMIDMRNDGEVPEIASLLFRHRLPVGVETAGCREPLAGGPAEEPEL